MPRYTKQAFRDSTELIDGNWYEECTFENCRLVYGGGEPPSLIGCEFYQSQFGLDDAAARTILFLRSIYHGMGTGGKHMVESTFDQIRGSALDERRG